MSPHRSWFVHPDSLSCTAPGPLVAYLVLHTSAAMMSALAHRPDFDDTRAMGLVTTTWLDQHRSDPDGVKSFVEGRLTAGATSAASAASGAGQTQPELGAFISTQSDALVNAAGDTLAHVEAQRCRFYADADGVTQAEALRDAMQAARPQARAIQHRASLAEWCNLVDQGQRFTARDPGRMDTTANGILGLDLDVASPSAPLRVTGAHLDGVPAPAREALRSQAQEGATIASLTPQGAGMTVRAIQAGHSPGLFGRSSSARVRIPLESTPARRNNPLQTAQTGSEGMFLIDRMRQFHNNPAFATTGSSGLNGYDFNQTPVAAQIIWTSEIANLPLRNLPNIDG